MHPTRAARAAAVLLALAAAALAGGAQQRRNAFDDPFLQVTSALPGCPVPRPPGFTEEEVRKEAHVRAQHGTSCHRVGRCRLPNSYLYDKEIIPRVQQYLRMDGRFDDTSVWVLGERRIVTLMGCVRTKEQAGQMEEAVKLVDDVMGVVNHLMVGTQGKPKYELAKP
ncbi:MAG TPA: BON domain-containing protein [Ramlibacter sp.]